jgi:aryl-alcohol dehydrogenase-like predicted oxidoreductase
MNKTKLGIAGPEVSVVGLGCMGMSGMYGESSEAESIATIHASLDAGINLIDTGDFYGMGHNEMLIAKALEGRRNQAVLSVKFGALRAPDGSWTGVDGRPAAVKNFLAYSLQRLKTEYIDVYRMARLDPRVPVEETVGAIADMVKAGYVKHIGLSEVGVDTIRKAHATHPICDLQIEYSLMSRGLEDKILPVLRELGIAVTAYGILSRGLLSGSRIDGRGDFRSHLPRFKGSNFEQNKHLVSQLAQIAAEYDATPSQLAIAWALSKGSDIIPVMGSRTRAQLQEVIAAAELALPEEAIGLLEEVFATDRVAGTRYDPAQMRMLDSER